MEYLVGGLSIFDFFEMDGSEETNELRDSEARDIAGKIIIRFPSVEVLEIRKPHGTIFLEVSDDALVQEIEREFACKLINASDESDLFWRFGETWE